MTKQTPAKLTEAQYRARFMAEKAKLRLHYCNLFKFWRACPLRLCRKQRHCAGDAQICLKRRGHEIAREVRWRARQDILVSKSAEGGPPERLAREFLPDGLT
jgi:hypothetical protein